MTDPGTISPSTYLAGVRRTPPARESTIRCHVGASAGPKKDRGVLEATIRPGQQDPSGPEHTQFRPKITTLCEWVFVCNARNVTTSIKGSFSAVAPEHNFRKPQVILTSEQRQNWADAGHVHHYTVATQPADPNRWFLLPAVQNHCTLTSSVRLSPRQYCAVVALTC